MSKKFYVGVAIAMSLAWAGWAIAQQADAGAKAPVAVEGGSSFVVAPGGSSAVLLDTKSGQTWTLNKSYEGESVWLPAKRIVSEQEAHQWLRREQDIKQMLAQEKQKLQAEEAVAKKQLELDEARKTGK